MKVDTDFVLCTFEIGFILLLFLGLRLLKAFPSETWPMSSMHLWTLTDKSCFNVVYGIE